MRRNSLNLKKKDLEDKKTWIVDEFDDLRGMTLRKI